MKNRHYESAEVALKNEVAGKFYEDKQFLSTSGGKIIKYRVLVDITKETKKPHGLTNLEVNSGTLC